MPYFLLCWCLVIICWSLRRSLLSLSLTIPTCNSAVYIGFSFVHFVLLYLCSTLFYSFSKLRERCVCDLIQLCGLHLFFFCAFCIYVLRCFTHLQNCAVCVIWFCVRASRTHACLCVHAWLRVSLDNLFWLYFCVFIFALFYFFYFLSSSTPLCLLIFVYVFSHIFVCLSHFSFRSGLYAWLFFCFYFQFCFFALNMLINWYLLMNWYTFLCTQV